MTNTKNTEQEERRLPPCINSPSCAEHARLDDMEPCDDGRGAQIHGRRKEDKGSAKK